MHLHIDRSYNAPNSGQYSGIKLIWNVPIHEGYLNTEQVDSDHFEYTRHNGGEICFEGSVQSLSSDGVSVVLDWTPGSTPPAVDVRWKQNGEWV